MTPHAAAAAERLLAEAGVRARVAPDGHDGAIARITTPPAAWAALVGPGGAELAARIRALGFKYVAIEMDGATGDDIDDDTP